MFSVYLEAAVVCFLLLLLGSSIEERACFLFKVLDFSIGGYRLTKG